jgi:hypothetical protein
VAVIELKGANLAMWNVARYQLSIQEGRVLVDNEPLIFFHFHGLRRPRSWLFNLSTAYYRVSSSHTLLWGIFVPYIRHIAGLEREHALSCRPGGQSLHAAQNLLTPQQKLRLTASILVNILRRNSVVLVKRGVLALP